MIPEKGKFGEYLTHVSNDAQAEQQRIFQENARRVQEEAIQRRNEKRSLATAFVNALEPKTARSSTR